MGLDLKPVCFDLTLCSGKLEAKSTQRLLLVPGLLGDHPLDFIRPCWPEVLTHGKERVPIRGLLPPVGLGLSQRQDHSCLSNRNDSHDGARLPFWVSVRVK